MSEMRTGSIEANVGEAASTTATEKALIYRNIIDMAFSEAGINLPDETSRALDEALAATGKATFYDGVMFGMAQGTAFAARLTIPSPRR